MAMIPVSWNYCILRVSSEQDRRSWMTNIEHQIEYSNAKEHTLLQRADSFDLSPSDDEVHEEEKGFPVSENKESPPLETLEAAEEMFYEKVPDSDDHGDDLQRNLLNELAVQQKNTIKTMEKKTMKSMEEWKKELEGRLINMEKKLTISIGKSITQTQSGKLNLSYWQLTAIILLCIVIGKIF